MFGCLDDLEPVAANVDECSGDPFRRIVKPNLQTSKHQNLKLDKNMVCTVRILKNVYGGDGLGRLGDGRVVFVPGAFSGELVKAEINESRRGYVKASLVEIIEPSRHRIGEGPSPVPGMVYSNISREGELELKREQLAEFFSRARFDVEIPKKCEFALPGGNYRNKVVYHLDVGKGHIALGYMKEPEHEVVDIVEDPLAVKEINSQLGFIRQRVFALLTQGAKAVRDSIRRKETVTIRYSRISGVQWWLGDDAPRDLVIKEMTLGKMFQVPADGFWQVNRETGEALVKAVKDEYLRGARECPDIVDLYCGVGVFGIICKVSGGPEARLTGVESGRAATEFAKINAQSCGVEGKFWPSEVSYSLRRMRIPPRATVILDPPRGGLEKGVAKSLVHSRAGRIFYVSCDPATLMRDLKELRSAYEIESVKWFDMFPRTARFETFVTLRRRA